MKTSKIIVNYELDDTTYRARVREACHPVPKRETAAIFVGDLSPDAREALLDVEYKGWLKLADEEFPEINWSSPRSDVVTAEDLSAALGGAAAGNAIVRGLSHLGVVCRASRAQAEEALREAKMAEALSVWESDHAAARTAGFPARGAIYHFEGGHGDGYGVPESLRDRVRALREAIELEIEADKAASNAIIRAWVEPLADMRGRTELARAAREGRNLGGAPKRLLEGLLTERCRTVVPDAPVIDDWFGTTEARDGVPTQEAYRVLDALTGTIAELGAGLPFPVEVSPLSRVDIAPTGGTVYRTGCVVSCGPASVAVLAEPLDYDPDNDDED